MITATITFNLADMPATHHPVTTDTSLRGVRVLSVALNLPGPAALMRLADMGATTLGGTPKQLADHLASEIDRWGRIVREAKIEVK